MKNRNSSEPKKELYGTPEEGKHEYKHIVSDRRILRKASFAVVNRVRGLRKIGVHFLPREAVGIGYLKFFLCILNA